MAEDVAVPFSRRRIVVPVAVGGDQHEAWQRMLDNGVLVRDVGLPRRQVAFMGYWREGKQSD